MLITIGEQTYNVQYLFDLKEIKEKGIQISLETFKLLLSNEEFFNHVAINLKFSLTQIKEIFTEGDEFASVVVNHLIANKNVDKYIKNIKFISDLFKEHLKQAEIIIKKTIEDADFFKKMNSPSFDNNVMFMTSYRYFHATTSQQIDDNHLCLTLLLKIFDHTNSIEPKLESLNNNDKLNIVKKLFPLLGEENLVPKVVDAFKHDEMSLLFVTCLFSEHLVLNFSQAFPDLFLKNNLLKNRLNNITSRDYEQACFAYALLHTMHPNRSVLKSSVLDIYRKIWVAPQKQASLFKVIKYIRTFKKGFQLSINPDLFSASLKNKYLVKNYEKELNTVRQLSATSKPYSFNAIEETYFKICFCIRKNTKDNFLHVVSIYKNDKKFILKNNAEELSFNDFISLKKQLLTVYTMLGIFIDIEKPGQELLLNHEENVAPAFH